MSNENPWTDSKSEDPIVPPKKPMNGCLLASLIVGGLGMVCLMVCCGAFAWFAYTMRPTITNVEAEVRAASQQILNIHISDDFIPENAVTMDNIVFTNRTAKFRHKEGKGQLLMGAIKLKIGDPNQAKLQSGQMRGPLEVEARNNLDIKKTESREIMINGQKTSVAIGEATDRTTGKAVHTADLDLSLPSGETFILLRMDDDIWDEAAVLKMLEQSKVPGGE
jgi:hypothetical protein